MKRILLFLCAVLLLGLLAWLLSQREYRVKNQLTRVAIHSENPQALLEPEARTDTPTVREATSTPVAGAPDATTTPTAEAVRPEEGYRLSGRIRGVGGEVPEGLELRVGLAYVSEEDREELFADQGDNGPEDYFELANVARWLPIAVDEQGHFTSQLLPPAELYRLIAWSDDGAYFFADHIPLAGLSARGDGEVGLLSSFTPTELRIELDPALRDQGWRLIISRLEGSVDEEFIALAALHQITHARVLAMYREQPLPLEGSLTIGPLYPDPSLELMVLTPDGTRGKPREVTLRRGTTRTLTLKADDLPDAAHLSTVDLRGQLVLDGADEEFFERVQLEIAERPTLVPDAAGFFTVEDLPLAVPTTIRVIVQSEEGRPQTPEFQNIVFSPDPDNPDAVQFRTWPLTSYRWLVLELDALRRNALRQRLGPIFPVYVLQREEDDWVNLGADIFFEQEDGLAVSMLEPGTYRVGLVTGPLHTLWSEPVVLSANQAEVRTSVELVGNEASYRLRCLDGEGQPLAHALLLLVGDHGGLPPQRVETDQNGEVELGPVNASRIFLSAGESEYEIDPRGNPGTLLEVTISP